ncbi:MAG: nitroreductase [Gammaproteobacteria bacterium]|nr:nitroreductase [Gammaproteobacteria bacterium]
MNPTIRAMLERCSQPRLQAPAPSGDVLETIMACALRAPDHALLRPWRYLLVEGGARQALGDVFEAAGVAATPDMDAGQREKLRAMPLRAPLLILPIACLQTHPKVPMIEQELSAAVGVGYVLLALQAAGFGGVWRTGDMAYSPQVHRALGLADHERLLGFLYAGTPVAESRAVVRPAVAEHVSLWRPELL